MRPRGPSLARRPCCTSVTQPGQLLRRQNPCTAQGESLRCARQISGLQTRRALERQGARASSEVRELAAAPPDLATPVLRTRKIQAHPGHSMRWWTASYPINLPTPTPGLAYEEADVYMSRNTTTQRMQCWVYHGAGTGWLDVSNEWENSESMSIAHPYFDDLYLTRRGNTLEPSYKKRR